MYDKLSETVAWYMLTRIGYSGLEAAKKVGFAAIPQGYYMETIRGLTATEGPLDIAVSIEMFHSALQQWSFRWY